MLARASNARHLWFIGVLLLYVYANGGRLHAAIPWDECDVVCDGTEQCNTSCFVDGIAFENGDQTTCFADYEPYDWGQACCGDGVCALDSDEPTLCEDDCPPLCISLGCGGAVTCDANQACVTGGCCVAPCGPAGCGGTSRSCGLTGSSCNSDSDCCSDETCTKGTRDLGYLVGYGELYESYSTCTKNQSSVPVPSR